VSGHTYISICIYTVFKKMKGLFEYSLLFSSLPAVSRMQSTEGGRERGLVLADKTASRDEAGTGACGIANW
jgi:hypothetical protein